MFKAFKVFLVGPLIYSKAFGGVGWLSNTLEFVLLSSFWEFTAQALSLAVNSSKSPKNHVSIVQMLIPRSYNSYLSHRGDLEGFKGMKNPINMSLRPKLMPWP